MRIKFLQKTPKYWHIVLLFGIFLLAFWLRSFPARYNELQAIDPFYLYRMSEYVVNHNFQLPEIDTLRNYPFGTYPWKEVFMPFYFPAVIYVLGFGWGTDYFHFALIWPAVLGALATIIMYFVGKEMFNKETGILSAFILAVLPAFITRTSAGFFEKEPIAGVFSLLSIYFFIKAYKNSDIRHGILGGISLFLLTQSWGGSSYFVVFLSGFVVVLLLLNKDIDKLLKSAFPLLVIPIILNQPLPSNIFARIYSTSGILASATVVLLIIRYLSEKYSLVKKEQLSYLVPSLLGLGFVTLLIGSMFFEEFYNIIEKFYAYVTLRPNVALSTVAESQPGSWNAIISVTSTSFSSLTPQLEFLRPYFSVWIFAVFGLLLLFYKIYKARDYTVILPIIWFISAIWGALGFIRLTFIIGPPFALLSAFTLSWILEKSLSADLQKIHLNDKRYIYIPLAAIFILFAMLNIDNAYAYSRGLGPSICFPNPDILIDGKKCIEYNDGNWTYKKGQPWYEALDYLRTNTTENSVVLSWWDFGYWFETRGNRPTVTDGGWGNRYETAIFFTTEVKNWNETLPWLRDKHNVSYLLMDYTLPGKYGAISKIATNGEMVIGMFPFRRNQIYSQGNKTVYEFTSGPYAVWIPMENDRIAGTPMFLITQNGQYVQKSYVNDICTTNGIITVGNETPGIKGCIAVSGLGIYYIPPEAEHTIFTSLMFMDGYGLPVEKVFDNTLIKIYKIKYK